MNKIAQNEKSSHPICLGDCRFVLLYFKAADPGTSITETAIRTLVALKTGMRRGEICGLKWDCVDLQNGIIHVRRNLVFGSTTSSLNEYPKTDCSIRDLPITPVLDAKLRRMKSESNFMESLNKERLTAWHSSRLQLFRHLCQKSSEIRQDFLWLLSQLTKNLTA